MDLVFLTVTLSSLGVILLAVFFFLKKTDTSGTVNRAAPNANANRNVQNEGLGRRAQMLRNRGARLQQNIEDENEDDNAQEDPSKDLEKLGAKKKAKLEAKAEKKHQRELEKQSRLEKKKRDEKQQEERRKAEAKELELQKQREEEEKRVREEKEKREQEDYLRMKEAFSVEEEGYDDFDASNEGNLLEEFVSFVKTQKVVVIEDLAQKFKLKTQTTIDRIKDLQSDGILNGVIDDRGKFIYITAEEMNAIVKFIKQRGRVSIQELADNSNLLIKLAPTTS